MLDQGLAHPTIFVRDLDRSQAFYERIGLRMDRRASTGVFLTAGGGTIYPIIHRPDATPPSHTVAGFQVEDLPAVVASMRDAGVEFEEYDGPGVVTENGIADLGSYRAAWFRDPDGNYIGVHEAPND